MSLLTHRLASAHATAARLSDALAVPPPALGIALTLHSLATGTTNGWLRCLLLD